jgi:hypothetical protein
MEYFRKKACNQCRLAKTRCSLDTSTCSRCQKRKLPCKYEHRPCSSRGTPSVDAGLFHSWLGGSNPACPSPTEHGNSSTFSLSEPFKPPGTISGTSDILEFHLPPDPVPNSLSEMIDWNTFQNAGITTLGEQHSHQHISDNDIFGFEFPSCQGEALSPSGRQFSFATVTERSDPLFVLSGAVKQSSKLALASWQVLKGITTQLFDIEGR